MNEQQKQEVKERLEEYVRSITTQSNKSSTSPMYVCPLCNSGTGKHKTGAFNIYGDNHTQWKCLACGEYGDIFDLIGKYEHLTERKDQFIRAAELFNIDTGKDNPTMPITQNTPISSKIAPQEEKEIKAIDFTADIEKATQNLNTSPKAKEYLHSRGLTDAIIDKYKIGYCPTGIGEINKNHKELDLNYYEDKYKYIFPVETLTDNGNITYYFSEIEDRTEEKPKYKFLTGLDKPIFNEQYFKNPPKVLFITEGVYDALSIEQVGGKAIALLGSSTQKLYKLIDQYKPKDTLFVIATDNDKTGKETAITISNRLYELGYNRTINHPSQCKDANEFMIKDLNSFKLWIESPLSAELEEYSKQTAAADLLNLEQTIKDRADFNYYPTGYNSLDIKIDGGLYAGLYIVGAVSSMGKTTQVLQMADQLAERGNDILFISLEQSKYELMVKSISRISYLLELKRIGCIDAVNSTQLKKQPPQDIKATPNAQSLRYIMNSKLQEQWSKETVANIQAAKEYYAKNIGCRYYIKEGVGNITVSQIREYVRNHKQITGRTPILVIDYLQILAPADRGAALGSDKRITDINVSELKQLSRDYNMPILAISSFNRENYNSPVSMTAFKESGAIEYSSDALFGIQPTGLLYSGKNMAEKNKLLIDTEKEKFIRTLEMVLLKNRNGQMSQRFTYFNYAPAFNCFLEVTDKEHYRLSTNKTMPTIPSLDIEPTESEGQDLNSLEDLGTSIPIF